MESKKVVITLGTDGSVKVEAIGFTGTSCQEATAFLDDLFGSPTEVTLKDSFYQQDKTVVVEGLPSGHCG